MTEKLVIGIVHPDRVDGYFFHSMMSLLTDQINSKHPLFDDVVCVISGPALQLGRGSVATTFMEHTDGDVLLMIDADMRFTIETIYQMWQQFKALPKLNGDKAKVLGGLAFMLRGPKITLANMQPTIWANAPDGSRRYVGQYDYLQDTLLKVAATGAACLMVHREVFQAVGDRYGHGRWFYHEHLDDGDELGEDLSFCRKVTDCGYGIYLHTALKFGHMKTVEIGEAEYIAARAAISDREIRVVGADA